ncbi:MAG: class I SAM-dependent methyltransferase [Candidatus Woesearchaeota archaeon]|nr:MAG: class I SAM-dependent methyltransferase [Candidatus Woesearchaeota archaeon]
MKTYYDQISKGYNELHKEEQLNKVYFIKEHIKINKGDKLLDVGCGTGISGEAFLDVCDVVGIDTSKEMIRWANFKTFLGRAEELPFENKSFDIVVCLSAIQNFEDMEKAVKEIERVARRVVVISIIKKSVKADILRNLLEDYEEFKEEKDFIFIKSIT